MPHSSSNGDSGGGGGGGSLHGMPDDWYPIMLHYVLGFQNMSQRDFSAPIIKPALVHSYAAFVVQYVVLAVIAIAGNVAMLVYIVRHRLYRDVTHAFLTNLAVAHLVLVCVVMPMTVMVIIVQNWIYGQFMCFFTPLLQDIPMHVALLTHLLIAWDRMRWLADPTRGRLPSFVCSCATWLTGMIIALPFPIYTTYLDMGQYFAKFRGVGICMVNLVDDMHEYMRGLFVIMYVLPATLLAYMYIRTAREFRPHDSNVTMGGGGVMMFEPRVHTGKRLSLHRSTSTTKATSNTPSATRTGTQKNCVRSFDLYDAELDGTRERRTQHFLSSMAATQVVFVCPLMVMKIARMVLIETYENSASFDITYLVFVWLAFIPTCINPILYGFWVLSPPMKERLRGYFRLSGRKCDQKPPADAEMSTTTTNNATDARTPVETTDSTQLSEKKPTPTTNNRSHHPATPPSASSSLLNLLPSKGRHPKPPKTAFARSTEVRPVIDGDSTCRSSNGDSGRSDQHRIADTITPTTPPTLGAHASLSRHRRDSTYSTDPLLNSCSDITVSTPIGSGSMLAAQQRLHAQQQQQQQRSAVASVASNHALNKRNNTLNSSLYSIAASSSSSERKSLQTPPLLRLPDIVSDPDEAEYVASRCTSVSTYTNELEMDALERRRSLVSPAFVDGGRDVHVGGQHQQHVYQTVRGGRQSLDSTERLLSVGQTGTALATGRRLPHISSRHRTSHPDPSATEDHMPNFPNQVFTHNRVAIVAAAVAAQSRPLHTNGGVAPNLRVTTLRSTSLPVANTEPLDLLDDLNGDDDDHHLDAMVPVYREPQLLAPTHSNHTLSSASLGAAAAMRHHHHQPQQQQQQHRNASTKVANGGGGGGGVVGGRRHLHSTGGIEYRLRNGDVFAANL